MTKGIPLMYMMSVSSVILPCLSIHRKILSKLPSDMNGSAKTFNVNPEDKKLHEATASFSTIY